ncbi:MAG: acetate--CoA ligase family protein [Deltaproteobacteria bacterium]|nr:acetate--CoA ligase family protein [Deltaproteobacteria bacterium]
MPDSIDAVLRPRSIAVIGASRARKTVGGELFFNLLHHGFTGPVYPVNPKADVVQSVHAYRTVADVPQAFDLAICAVPAPFVLEAVAECAKRGAKAVVVLSAGFRETGEAGAALERELAQLGRRSGMRIVGPNCLGVLNTDPEVRLNGTFAEAFPGAGPVAFVSQSGALGAAVLERAKRLGLGLSSFVSIGNRCDVSANDLLEYLEADQRTSVTLLYLESFGNPARFTRIARRVCRTKPIVAVKSGRTTAGSRAAASHTGALAGTDVAVDALLSQAGVIRVDNTNQLFDVGMLLASQPIPRGRRIAIVTNAGGPGILAADACENHLLEVTALSGTSVSKLADFLPPEATLTNPVDMIASATAEDYARAVKIVLEDEHVDMVLVIFVPPLMIGAPEVAAAIGQAAAGSAKPVVSCFMGAHGFPIGLHDAQSVKVPSYSFPEAATYALARAATYGEWLQTADSPLLESRQVYDPPLSAARSAAKKSDQGWLPPDEIADLLGAYGIRTAQFASAQSAQEAVQVAERVGFPAVLKIANADIPHKSDIGGVLLDLRESADVEQGFATLQQRLKAAGHDQPLKVIVQSYLADGIEAVVGVTSSATFGALLMFGLGGVHVELIRDVVFKLHPMHQADLEEMIWAPRAAGLLRGYRGAPPADVEALKALICAVNQLVTDVPELAEMDLNPIKLLPPGQGCVVVDARIRFA